MLSCLIVSSLMLPLVMIAMLETMSLQLYSRPLFGHLCMANKGYNPLIAIQIALAGEAHKV
ncbi:hypothetical protein SAMN05421690_102429 [Nitrosomonas sp. Nm51]|nr:hypothetical protein SAMN05421690_102429 [Nitrosomonas sp. Nm51]